MALDRAVKEKIRQEIESAREAFLYKNLLKEKISGELSLEDCRDCVRCIEEQGRKALIDYFKDRIKGQDEMVHGLTLALILNEHVLLEGLPGVGKSIMIEWIARVVGLPFQRVQFIPDMLPSDLIGKDYLDPLLLQKADKRAIQWINGPIFSSIVMADEINRAPSKVQAALLEAMGENQITPFGKNTMMVRSPIHEAAIRLRWDNSRKLGGLFQLPLINPEMINLTQFNVFATMNPIEQEGTYPLSEAQLDRFCFKINVPYPDRVYYEDIAEAAFKAEMPDELRVVRGNGRCEDYFEYFKENPEDTIPILAPFYFFLACRDHIFGYFTVKENSLWKNFQNSRQIQRIYDLVYLSSLKRSSTEVLMSKPERVLQGKIQTYIERDINRDYHKKVKSIIGKDIFQYIRTGASPRGFLKLIKAVMGEILIRGENNIEAIIVKNAKIVLKHRIRMEVHAKIEGKSEEDIIEELCQAILG